MPRKVIQLKSTNPKIIAPCGLNRSLCRAYMRENKPCPGCRGGDSNKSKSCLACAVRNCEERAAGRHQFCSSCARSPRF